MFRYLFAILVPPLAVLSTGRIFHTLFSIVLTAAAILLFIFSLGVLGGLYIVAIIHAIIVVHGYHQQQRDERLIKAMKEK
ncbi:YqaE/Pmp3 family membrane protein [Idiomarina tyrosinivorans]|uniref:YqaE/Pmp3 family membrane protein n=1 Tax=Idiomarina tyrosinivorans TaxID=1445662 RepID=A0A432ZPV7_9GAMM|nr:YqaE/Pmp3 family membrane protein [Idiomarina tyrosinivorans]RUO79939.1 YqaE/Pmp3 family membrane protein [Idiomarina tyrosinivorans]